MRLKNGIRFIMLTYMLLPFILPSAAQSTWNTVGNAQSQGADCFLLTHNLSGQRGAAWSQTQLNLRKPFNLYYRFNFGNNNNGADGITVVLQKSSAGLSALGIGGYEIGYGTITPSLDIEFDTYENVFPAFDILDDHCSIQGDGLTAWTLASAVPLLGPGINVEDNQYHIVQVNWQPSTTTTKVYFDCNLVQTLNYDLVNGIFGGDSMVYYGITSATGLADNAQYFCELYLNAGIDSAFCPGIPVTLHGATNFSSYSWSPAQGLSCTNCLSPVANPNDSTAYVLTASYGCLTARDTMILATNCVFLPIELTFFTASCNANTSLLNWNTAAEYFNDYFQVERSVDAIHYQTLTTVDAAGNSSSQHNYSFTDEQPLPGTNYYRLKQVDFDGTSTYSNVQSVMCTSQLGLFVYPNPSHDITHLQIESSVPSTVTYAVINLSGTIVFEKEVKLVKGSNEVLLDNHQMIPGIYDVAIVSHEKVLHTLLVIQ